MEDSNENIIEETVRQVGQLPEVWELAYLCKCSVTCTGISAVKTTREVAPEDPP